MQPSNPYEPPQTDSALEELETPRIYVDGPHLVIASGTELPPRCIKTNQSVSENDAVHQTLQWRGRTFHFTVSNKECEIVWYATPWIVWKSRIRKIAELLMWAAFVFPLFFLTEDKIWPKAMMGFAIVMLSLVVMLKRELRIVNYRNNRFWIEGCCPEFLESLQSELRSSVGN